MTTVEAGSRARAIESAEPPSRLPLAEGTGVGPYRILALIASGGMGDVYRARDERLGRDVALKVLPTGLTDDRERLERFAQEAKSASALNHPHIVAIYEIGEAQCRVRNAECRVIQHPAGDRSRRHSAFGAQSSTVESHDSALGTEHSALGHALDTRHTALRTIHYIAMELVEGETLREFAAGRPPMAQRLEVLAQTAEGLGKAHAAGIVHRDLKPDNVMISNEGYAKVVDFGLAKLVEPAHGWNPLGADSPTMRAITQQGELIGTAGYMSPEQILGKPIDQRSDIFSFGCIVYEVVTGRRPFDGESFVDTLHEVLHAVPPPILHPNEHMQQELQRIVGKCLVKDRENRYQSIRDVALDLRALAGFGAAGRNAGAPRRDLIDDDRGSNSSVVTPRRSAAAAVLVAVIAVVVWLVCAGTPAKMESVASRPLPQRITTNGRVAHLTISPDGRFAGYVVQDDEAGEAIWLQQLATGSHIAAVPASKKMHYAGVSFSADSSYLIATRYEDSVYGAVTQLPILGGKQTTLVRDADTAASPSPDGRQLVLTRDVLDKGESRVIVTARDGSHERVMATLPLPKTAMSPSWSPDGSRIAVAHGQSLFTIDVATGVKKRVPLAGWPGAIRDVAWSPAGDALIVSAADEQSAGHFRLLRVNMPVDLPSGAVTNLTSDADDYIEPRPTAGSIAAIQIKYQATLWAVTPGGNGSDALAPSPIQLTRGLGTSDGLAGATSTHDGRIIYSSSAGGTIDLRIANSDGSEARQLTNDGRLESYPVVTRDDSTIVYLSRARGTSTLWRMNIDGSQPQAIAAGPAIYDFAVTPDGKHVIYALGDDATKRSSLISVPIDGGPPFTIATTGVFLRSLAIAPDGRTVVFSTLDDEYVKLFKVAIGGGKPERLVNVRSGHGAISPDGKLVACAYDIQETSAKLAILPLAGGKPLQILDLHGKLYRWTPDGKAIVYIRHEGRQENLFRQPLAGGAPRSLTNFTDGSIANFEWSPDGKRILLTHYIQTRDVVLVNAGGR